MNQPDPVEELLRQLQREAQMHSRGVFTLDPGRNRDQMAAFLEQDQAAWSYWFTRAGVGLGALGCHFQVGHGAILAGWELPERWDGLEEFWAGEGESPGLSLLRSCLLWTQSWLCLHPEFTARLIWQRPRRPQQILQVRSDQVVRLEEECVTDRSQLFLFLQTDSRTESELARQRRHLQQGLAGRCRLSPIPVTLDNRRLDTGRVHDSDMALYLRYYLDGGRRHRVLVVPPAELPAHHYRLEGPSLRFSRPRFCLPAARVHTFSLAGRLEADANWSEKEGRELASWSTSEGAGQLRALGLPVEESASRWAVRAALHRSGQSPDQWTALHYGLLLDWEPLDLSRDLQHGWSAVVGLDGVGTDLSGLRMTCDQLARDVADWLRQEIIDIHAVQVAVGA